MLTPEGMDMLTQVIGIIIRKEMGMRNVIYENPELWWGLGGTTLQ